MNLAADLDEFFALHRAHGRLTPTVGDLTPNGYRLELVLLWRYVRAVGRTRSPIS